MMAAGEELEVMVEGLVLVDLKNRGNGSGHGGTAK